MRICCFKCNNFCPTSFSDYDGYHKAQYFHISGYCEDKYEPIKEWWKDPDYYGECNFYEENLDKYQFIMSMRK